MDNPTKYKTADILLAAGFSACSRVVAGEAELEAIQAYGNALENPSGLNLDEQSSAASRLGLLMQTPACAEIISRDEIAGKVDYTGLSAVTRATGFYSSGRLGSSHPAVSSLICICARLTSPASISTWRLAAVVKSV